ncbi:MAG: restriction endonuclease subunit S [Coleofasciculus sp. G3-WIS-01]|uniref:restriction endonuclease subunit S n=1 Tax=Coleofasciculus sp. G3-WIS-01 TaxID=3069528 RepID=UPI0032F3967C
MILTTPQNYITTPWKLPNGWEWIPLGEICDIAIGGTPSRNNPEYWGTGKTWISIADLNGSIVESSKEEITELGVANSNVKLVKPNTILMSFKLTIGKLGIAGKPLYTNEAIAALPIKNNWQHKMNLEFLFRALGIVPLAQEADVAVKGKTLNKKKLARILIPVPFSKNPVLSLDIQNRVVSRIESLLSELKGDHKLVKKMRRDTDRFLNTSLNEVFKNLEPLTKIVPLREVATSFNGRASGQGNSNVRVFKTRHVYPHSLRLDNPSYMKEEQAQKLPPDRYLKPGDVLMANIAEGTLGRVTYVHECEDDWTVDTQIMILRSKDEDILHGKWLYYYLWSERGQHEILSRRSGIAFAEKRGQTHIYPKNVLEIPVPKPPIDQQRQAIVHLDSILSHVESMQEIFKEDINLLDRLEQSILEKAFQGQL